MHWHNAQMIRAENEVEANPELRVVPQNRYYNLKHLSVESTDSPQMMIATLPRMTRWEFADGLQGPGYRDK